MATGADEDIYEAVVALWSSSKPLNSLTKEPPRSGRIKPKELPYVRVIVTKDKENERYTGGAYNDYRKCEFVILGQKADCIAILAAAQAVFNLQLGSTDDNPATNPKFPTLTMPSGALFRQWWPLNDGELVIDETTKSGLDVWRATLSGRVWTVRT